MPHPAPLTTAEMVTVPQLCFHTRGYRFPIGIGQREVRAEQPRWQALCGLRASPC
ncbi:MAG: hypothetical protein K0S98_1108 [Propionibacteriaceae bacterium]|jgi:hypothetical protein|nr:hypothetical protein [Propionibacteriaceae bacterium]